VSIGAADQWRRDLQSWAIPPDILARAPEDPWTFPVELFVSRAMASAERLTFSNHAALVALPEGGTVLDVGCGAGSASMPLAAKASEMVGVDTGPEMLAAFAQQARAHGVAARTVQGRWPDVANSAAPADVAVCHHVFYNAPYLAAFATALTTHARRRVVAEMTTDHPQTRLNPLWLRFHGLRRPTRPTAMDAVAVLREAGLDVKWQQWEEPRPGGFARAEDIVAWVRRQLCLPPDRDPEVHDALAGSIVEHDGLYGFPDRPVVTVWWDGRPRD
jgi:SAM-dependent methyltransferase